MAPNQVKLQRTIIGINNSFSTKQLKRILTQLGVDKAKIKEAETLLVPSRTKLSYIKLIKETATSEKLAFYFFAYRRRLNFVCEKASETEVVQYSGFRAFQNTVKEADIVTVKENDEKPEERGFENQKLQEKFLSAISPLEIYEMDTLEEVYKNVNNEGTKVEKPIHKEVEYSEEVTEETKFDTTLSPINTDQQQTQTPGTPLRNPRANFDVETPIHASKQTFNEMLDNSMGLASVPTTRQFNNQSMRKIKLDEYNFDTDDNRNPNDWLANAIFCLDLEDRAKKLGDGEKISSLMRALKGNLKETIFAKLRETPPEDLTLQRFQELFRKHTTKSIREIENRLARVTKSKAGSYQDLYMQINNLIVEQMMVSGVTKEHLNKEVIEAMTERLFKKKCHPNSETFQTTTKKGQELIDLADELNELSESKSLNAISKILPEKPFQETPATFPIEKETRKCFRCGKIGHLIGSCRAPDNRQRRNTSDNIQQSYNRGWVNNSRQNTWRGGTGRADNYQPNRSQNDNVNHYPTQLGTSNFRGNYNRGSNMNRNWVNNRNDNSFTNSQNFNPNKGENRRGNNRSSRGDWGNQRY